MVHRFRQLGDLARAIRLHLQFRETEFGTSEDLKRYQQAQLSKVVRHAAEHSPFYRQLVNGLDLDGDIRLEDLPIIDKRLMMGHFDDWVTDPRLKLAEIERQIATDPEEQYYLGEYRIVATSGSSGLRGIFVYDRKEWSVVIAAALRWAGMFGVSPLELGYKKLASVKADAPTHATSRLGQSMNVGIRNLLMLDATAPLPELVAELNAFQPALLMGYASLISLLAIEQAEGRIRIQPEMIATFSEMLGEDRVRRVQQAWGQTPFNHYGAAEQVMIAADCSAHKGLHHFADMSIVEIVDENNKPVAPGVPGHKILLTNLHKFVQPVIRYEMTDIITLSSALCDCGRPFPLFSNIGGRTEDIITLHDDQGHPVMVSPMLVATSMIEIADVIEYQYSVTGDSVALRIVPRKGASTTLLTQAVKDRIESELVAHGAHGFIVSVECVNHLVRTGKTMGKLKLGTA